MWRASSALPHHWLVAPLLGVFQAEVARAQACANAAGDDNCASYVSTVDGQLSHCESVLKTGLRVEDVCAQSCGRCGTLPEADSEPACFSSSYQAGTPFFANCCQVALNFPEASGAGLACASGDCTVCWGSDPVVPGRFETCCLDQDPCRNVDCGHGTCVSNGDSSVCHCAPGWVGQDGKEGRAIGAVAPYCNTWHGFHAQPVVYRLDGSDGNLYTRADFLAAYNSGSDEWDSAAGLEAVCWDPTFTFDRCCSPAGSGDPTCWFGDTTYENCLCENPCASLDCGVHGACDATTGTCVCLAGYTGANCESWHGHFLLDGAEARLDPAVGEYSTRAEFDTKYGSTSASRWNAQIGRVRHCWDATYTYNECCSPLDGTGDTSCWAVTAAGDQNYDSCQCEPPVDCVGAWGECRSDCSSVYAVSTEASGGGLVCEAADGAKRACSPGVGDCELCESNSGSRTGYSIAADTAASSTVGGLKGQFLCSDNFLSRDGADAEEKCQSLPGCTYASTACSGVPTAVEISCRPGFSGIATVLCPTDSTQFEFNGCNENACAAIAMDNGVVPDSSSGDGCVHGLRLTTDSDTTCDVKCNTETHVEQTGTMTCASDAEMGDTPTGVLTCISRQACSELSCSPGWSADTDATNDLCIGSSCDASVGDLETCCTENSCAAISFAPGVVPDNAAGDACTAGLVLTTSSDSSCDVKCDETTHVAQSGTVACASDASAGQATTGQPGCVARAACSTIQCADGWVADSSAASTLCAGETCDVGGADNDLCCNARAACSTIQCPSDTHVADSLAADSKCIGAACDDSTGDLDTC
eukprot:COSAG02_NODE_322_length_24779_cov_14.118233_1_plen_814_part_10